MNKTTYYADDKHAVDFEIVHTNDRHPKGVFRRLRVPFRHEFDYIALINDEYYGVDLHWNGSSVHTKIDISKYI